MPSDAIFPSTSARALNFQTGPLFWIISAYIFSNYTEIANSRAYFLKYKKVKNAGYFWHSLNILTSNLLVLSVKPMKNIFQYGKNTNIFFLHKNKTFVSTVCSTIQGLTPSMHASTNTFFSWKSIFRRPHQSTKYWKQKQTQNKDTGSTAKHTRI